MDQSVFGIGKIRKVLETYRKFSHYFFPGINIFHMLMHLMTPLSWRDSYCCEVREKLIIRPAGQIRNMEIIVEHAILVS